MTKRRFDWKFALLIVGLLILVLLVRDFNNRMAELRLLSMEKEHVAAQVTSLAATRSHLRTQLALATSGAFLEEKAREANYSYEGDITIELMEGKASPDEASPPDQTAITPVARWQLWMALFIDPQSSIAP